MDTYKASKDDRILHLESAIYTFTEISSFASRLLSTADYGTGFSLQVDLVNSAGRRLVASPTRWLRSHYQTSLETVEVHRPSLSVLEVQSDPHALGRDMAMEFLDKFSFQTQERVIEDIQAEITSRAK